MEWNHVKAISDEGVIEEFERFKGYVFPTDFKEFIKEHNGGHCDHDIFDTYETKERVLNRLLSFNKTDVESIWKRISLEDEYAEETKGLDERYVAFANDPFGNAICFDRTNNHVIFLDHETDRAEEIAESFSEFIERLYRYEDDDF